MPATDETYETQNISKQHLPFDSPYFPAYFRLLKWKILDICVDSVRLNGIGYFSHFKNCFPPGKLEEIVRSIVDDPPSITQNPLFAQIRSSDGMEAKAKRHAETYLKLRHDHTVKVQRRRNAEYFLNKIMFNEEGLRIADKLVFMECRQVFGTVHWEDLPKDWLTTETFKNRFYDEKEVNENPYGMQRLDRVAGSARGMIIMNRLKCLAQCKQAYNVLLSEVNNRQNLCQTDLVKTLLDEGPLFELKSVDGEEKLDKAEKWNAHKTLILFLSITGFKALTEKEQEEWFYGLLEAMQHDPTNRAALYFLNKDYAEELEEREKEKARQRLQKLKKERTEEEAVGDEIFKHIRPQPADSGYNPETQVTDLVLRTYQEELVQPALEGKNCVCVAPTGSGKTEVAIYAALNHIRERHANRKDARVVMLVPKIPLVTQQKERFLKYCGGKYQVSGFHGSEKSDSGEGRRDDVLNAHIVVMTPQILINMLESVRKNERLYVSDFSMMVFDEVHRATKQHAYVIVSRIVEEWKYDKPQILGLTASLNVNAKGQNDMSNMLSDIYKMLAILNAPCLSTITHPASIDELNTIVSKPDDIVEVCREERGPFHEAIDRYLITSHIKLCDALESLSKSRHNCFPPNIYRSFRKSNPKTTETYESLLQTIILELNKLNTPEKFLAQAWAKYIKVYVEARVIVEVMPSNVAFRFMDSAIRELDKGKPENQFSETFMKNYDMLKNDAVDKEPLIVKKLKSTLVNQFRETPDSRVIIFVTQRTTAQRVCEFLNESRVMDEFRTTNGGDELIGYVLGTNKQGSVQQSSQEQARVLEKFNNGHMKIIVATSVVEEGLDVASCNLIIKYNCSSHSAIQLIQRRGRARAKNSKSVLLSVNSAVNEAENNALISEKFMRLCVKKIVDNGQKQLISEVENEKTKLANERARDLQALMNSKAQFENDVYRLHCVNCHTALCRSTDVKKVYSNYMIFDPIVWDYLLVESKKKASKYLDADTQSLSILKCAMCDPAIVIGKAYKMRGAYIPQINLKCISFHPEHAGEGTTMSKWKAVEEQLFFIGEATQRDFTNMLEALGNSEANIDKKRIMDLDSKQHIRDIENKKYRTIDEADKVEVKAEKEKKKEEQINEGTAFSEDEE